MTLKRIDILYSAVLLLNVSESFRIIMYAFELRSLFFSTLTLSLNVLYILLNFKYFTYIRRKTIYRCWLVALFVVPTLVIYFQFFQNVVGDPIYWISFLLLFSSLFTGAVIFALKVSYKYVNRIVGASLFITLLSFISNYFFPEVFRKIGELSGNKQAYVVHGASIERAVGFFSHPNEAAFSIVCFVILLMDVNNYKHVRLRKNLSVIGCCILLVFATGSRTSLLLFFIVFLFFFIPVLIDSFSRSYRIQRKIATSVITAGGVLGTILIFILFSIVSKILLSSGYEQLGGRFSFTSLLSSSSDDESVNSRIGMIYIYFENISQNFFFGIGPERIRENLDSGFFDHVSQNSFVEGIMTYGAFYLAFFIYALFYSYSFSNQSIMEEKAAYNPLKVFLLFVFLLCFSVSEVFLHRSTVIVFGLLIGGKLRRHLSVRPLLN